MHVEFSDVTVVGQSEMAIQVRIPEHRNGKPIWIPQSQIHDDSEVYKKGTSGKLIVTQWIAVAKRLCPDGGA